MNNRGETGIGMMSALLVVFVGVVAALALYSATLPFIGQTTLTSNLVNRTFTAPASGATIDLVGQELLGDPIVTNATSGALVPTTNYTISEARSTVDGLKRITYTTATNGLYNSRSVNISYNFGPEGYIDSGGGRAMTNLIVILAAMAIGIFALSRLGALEFLKG
jgi:hypothetical protein